MEESNYLAKLCSEVILCTAGRCSAPRNHAGAGQEQPEDQTSWSRIAPLDSVANDARRTGDPQELATEETERDQRPRRRRLLHGHRPHAELRHLQRLGGLTDENGYINVDRIREDQDTGRLRRRRHFGPRLPPSHHRGRHGLPGGHAGDPLHRRARLGSPRAARRLSRQKRHHRGSGQRGLERRVDPDLHRTSSRSASSAHSNQRR